jgi:hypothetical protein
MALMKVRYKGIADERTITKKQLEAVGVVIDSDLRWNHANGFQQNIEVNDRLEEVLREQGHFTLSAMDDAGSEKVVATASDPANEGNTLVDGNTGASTEAKKAEEKAQEPQSAAVGNPTGSTGKGSSTRGSST